MTLSTPGIERLTAVSLNPGATYHMGAKSIAQHGADLRALLSDRADLEAEVERLTQELEWLKTTLQYDQLLIFKHRAQAAEAENARLRDMLSDVINYNGYETPNALADAARALLHEGEK